MWRTSPPPVKDGHPPAGAAGAAGNGVARTAGGWKLLLMKPGRGGKAVRAGRGAWTAKSDATVAGLAETARGIAASVVAGRGLLLMKTGWAGFSGDDRTAGAAGFGRKTAKLCPALLPPAAAGEETSLIASFGTAAFVAAAICSALTPRLRILRPEKE